MNSARTLVLATRNQGKIAEMQRLLDSFSSDIQVRSSSEFNLDDVEETGSTFEENALLKAVTIARATGFPALADDSGLCVDVLGGAPGIYSARWAGTHGDDQANIEKLLGDLRKIPSEQRSAKFVCVIALALPNGESEVVRGELKGEIRFEPSGTNGFGYDPIFQPLGHQRTLAEMEPEEKDSISHRGFALREIAPRIAPFISR
mgnify:FL=1